MAHVVPEESGVEENAVEEPIAVPPVAAAAPPQTPKKDDPSRRYTVVKQPSEQPSPRRGPQNAPPKVISHKELLKPKQDFTYYDAILASEKAAKEDDEEMKNFMPMLEEYLKSTRSSLDMSRCACVDPAGVKSAKTLFRLRLPVRFRRGRLKMTTFGIYFIIGLREWRN